jgi:nucleoside-diphosphate-sugar epimerase
MKIYISGSNGFIGSALKNKYLSMGHDVINGDFELNDIGALYCLSPDAIIHCAAKVGSVNCQKDPKNAFETNVYGTWKIASVAKSLHAYFVFVSSIAVYDFERRDQSTLEITESTPIKPKTLYGLTKQFGEEISTLLSKDDGLIIRLGFMFGSPTNDPHSFISGIFRGSPPSMVGDYSKDYLHIDDCVDAIYSLSSKYHTGIYNIGSGQSYSITKISEYLKTKVSLDPSGDYFKSFFVNINKITEQTGWKPKINFWKKLAELKEMHDQR